MKTYLIVKSSSGIFPNEYVVSFNVGRVSYSALVHSTHLPNKERLAVEVLEPNGDQVLIKLPSNIVACTNTLWVPVESINVGEIGSAVGQPYYQL